MIFCLYKTEKRHRRNGNSSTISYAYDSLMRMTNVCFGTLSFCHGYLPHTRYLESVSNSCGIWAGNAGVFTSRFCGRQK
jgi:surface polysaccharide O-acyltransferase-like enzyme